MQRGQSPHHSVKVLPATPTTVSFPSNIRLVRATPPPLNVFNEGMPSGGPAGPGSPNPFSSGIMFAKRKKNIFKGPTLNFGAPAHGQRNSGSGSHSRSASASGLGRRSGEITIQEEDEGMAEEEEEIEEVDVFRPVIGGPGEKIEEQIFEENEPQPTHESQNKLYLSERDQDVEGEASTTAAPSTTTADKTPTEKAAC